MLPAKNQKLSRLKYCQPSIIKYGLSFPYSRMSQLALVVLLSLPFFPLFFWEWILVAWRGTEEPQPRIKEATTDLGSFYPQNIE